MHPITNTASYQRKSLAAVSFIVLWFSAWYCAAEDQRWIDINTQRATLRVMGGERTLALFENIAIGRYGTTENKRAGDNKTPLGHFRVAWIKTNTRFHTFFGLDYPTPDHAYRAFLTGLINRQTWREIRKAFTDKKPPPQKTALGGHIGIHGLGQADREIHDNYNWTNGCIALANEQIERLKTWVKLGTPVLIH